MAVVMMTGQATIETAVQAIKLGAYDYLTKPLEPEKLRAVLEGLKQVALAREAGALRQKLSRRWAPTGIDRKIAPDARALPAVESNCGDRCHRVGQR